MLLTAAAPSQSFVRTVLTPGRLQAGAGAVGLAAIQLAKRAGAVVIATASSADKLARLKDFGADHARWGRESRSG